jgi:hypothetical protein
MAESVALLVTLYRQAHCDLRCAMRTVLLADTMVEHSRAKTFAFACRRQEVGAGGLWMTLRGTP